MHGPDPVVRSMPCCKADDHGQIYVSVGQIVKALSAQALDPKTQDERFGITILPGSPRLDETSLSTRV